MSITESQPETIETEDFDRVATQEVSESVATPTPTHQSSAKPLTLSLVFYVVVLGVVLAGAAAFGIWAL